MTVAARKTLTIRPLQTRQDFENVLLFLRDNLSKTLPLPDAQSLRTAVAAGDVLVACIDDRIVASAGLFENYRGPDTRQAPKSADTSTYELAATRVIGKAAGGLSPHTLQDVLIWLRTISAVHARLQTGGRSICLLSAVLTDNVSSLAAMDRNGFLREPIVPGWLEDERRTWLSGQGVDYFWLPPAALFH